MKNTKFLTIGFLLILSIGLLSLLNSKQTISNNPMSAKFVKLSTNNNVACFGPTTIYSMDNSQRLQGSCCGPMSLHRYQEQVEGLKKYSNIDKIPSDPYDIPVSLTKELLDYDKNIKLTPEQ